MEDALALGNSARDSIPPRYEDAVLAYRLAAKLNPKDPRPYIGLGNVFHDQKKYEEAANSYKQALAIMSPKGIQIVTRGESRPTEVNHTTYSSHDRGLLSTYLGDTLLKQGQFAEAETTFKDALARDPDNAQLHALLGYTLFLEMKYDEAADSLSAALKLDRKNTKYAELLQQIVIEKRKRNL